jgi:parvulin-like peptidyl-prolyl isomerase
MARKEARGRQPSKSTQSSKRIWAWRISIATGTLAVLAVCIIARGYWGPDAASADTSATRPASYQSAARDNPPVSDDTPVTEPKIDPVDYSKKGIFAIVNDEQLTRDRIGRETLRRFGPEMLQSLLNRQLIQSELSAQKIVITENDIDEEINNIASKFGLSVDRWLEMLQKEREIDPRQYRYEIVWPTIALRRLAANRLNVTQEEIDIAMEAEFGPRVQVRVISMLKLEDARKVHQLVIQHPDEFGRYAKQYSKDASSASAEGMIPPIRKHVGDPEIEKAVYALAEGQISPIVQTANQFFIFKCDQHLPASYPNPAYLETTRARLADRIKERKLRTAGAELFKELQERSKVVNVYNSPELRQQMPGVAATVNGRRITVRELTDECIRRHGGDVLEGEINRTLLTQQLEENNTSVTREDIDYEIARAAESYGFITHDDQPDIDRWLKMITEEEGATVELYVRDIVWPSAALKKLVDGKIEITQEDLQRAFESNYGQRVEVLAIVLGDHRQAFKIFEMARNNSTDEFFGQLATQYSIEPVSRANAGRVPPIRRYGGQPKVEEVAFELEPGEVSGVISVGDKAIILRCLGRTKTLVDNINDVRGELVKDLTEKKLRMAMADEFDRIQRTARIENFYANTRQSGQVNVARKPETTKQ